MGEKWCTKGKLRWNMSLNVSIIKLWRHRTDSEHGVRNSEKWIQAVKIVWIVFKLLYKETMTNSQSKATVLIWAPKSLGGSELDLGFCSELVGGIWTMALLADEVAQCKWLKNYHTLPSFFFTKHMFERSDHLLLNCIWATLFPINYRDCGAIFMINWKYFFP